MSNGAEQLRAQMERELIAATSQRPETGSLYHYTTAAGLNGILREKQIRATHFMYLNDRDEMKTGEALVISVATELSETSGLGPTEKALCDDFVRQYKAMPLTRIVDVYVASLTEEGNDLGQWRAYGGQGGGYSIGLDPSTFPIPSGGGSSDAVMGIWLEKVEYDEAAMRELVVAELSRLLGHAARYWDTYAKGGDFEKNRAIWATAMTALFVVVGAFVTRYKNKAFYREQEWRIVATPSLKAPSGTVRFDLRPSGIVPYLNIPLCSSDQAPLAVSRIYVGPTQDAERGVFAAKQLVKDVDLDPELVQHSGIPLR